MADFFDTFDPWKEDEEEQQGLDLFGSPSSSTPSDAGFNDMQVSTGASDYERNWFERVFAPFEAPQQGLFKFTTEVGEDGFQAGDVFSSLGHAGRYFNPWANVEPIDPNEVREVFMGEDAEMNGFARFGSNLAISLLYDPLLFAGAAKGLGMLGDSATTYRAVRAATNPAEEIIGTSINFARGQVGSRLSRMAKSTLGAEKAETLGTRVMHNLVNKYHGVPDDLKRKAERLDNDIAQWRVEGYSIFKQAERMRGKKSQQLLAEALENEAVWLKRQGKSLSAAQERKFFTLERKLKQEGINEDLFFQVYDRARKLDDTIGRGLLQQGLISTKELEQYTGTHLRRQFMAFERPLDYIDRLEKLGRNSPHLAEDSTRLSIKGLRQNLQEFRKEFKEATSSFKKLRPDDFRDAVKRRDEWTQVAKANPRYFEDAGRTRLRIDHFSDDVQEFLDTNPDLPVSQVFDHIRENMLGVDPDGSFWKAIGDHLGAAKYTERGTDYYLGKLREMAAGRGHTFRTISEHAETVSKRENLRPEIREALGEVLEAAPRIGAEASDAGRLLETRKFLDNIAGVTRVDEDTGPLLAKAKEFVERGDSIPDDLRRQLQDKVGTDLSVEQLVNLDTGSVLRKTGTRLASSKKGGNRTMYIPKDSSYGELAGMHVTPAVGMLVKNLAGRGAPGSPAEAFWQKTGDLLRQGTGQFKILKVIMDPTAQVRNFIGNAVLMDLQGTSPFRVDRMIRSAGEIRKYMKTGEMGDMMKLADEAGLSLFQSSFARHELQDIAQYVSSDPVTRKNWMGALEGVYDGMQRTARDTRDGMMRAFEFNEQLFKMNIFTDKYTELAQGVARQGRKLTDQDKINFARQAGALAEQALFNYGDVPHLVDFARKYGVVPFATFPFKAAPYVAKTLYKHPHRVLKYHRTVEEWNESGPFQPVDSPDTVAREIEGLPSYLRDSLVAKLPFKDKDGRPLYMDLSYFMPWSAIQDMTQQTVDPIKQAFGATSDNPDPGDFGLRGGVWSPPAKVLIDAISRGEDSLGRPIFSAGMGAGDMAHAAVKYALNFWLPPSAIGGTRMDSIGRSLQAVVQSSPEPMPVASFLSRGAQLGEADGVNESRMAPQSNAQVNFDNPWAQAAGVVGGFLGGATASDPSQQAQQSRRMLQFTETEIARQIASIRTDPGLSLREKRERITRLRAQQQDAQEETFDFFGRLF